jgi:hypothetical protein
VVVDAALIEPVSTSNSLLAGNLAGNFLKKGPRRAILASKTRAASYVYEQIPCSTEQGIFLREQGILAREQGILEFWNFCAENLRSLDPKRRSRECISGTSGDPDSARMVAADFVTGAHLWKVWSTDRQPNHGRSL